MPRPRRYRRTPELSRVTVQQIATEVGLRKSKVLHLLRRNARWLHADRQEGPPGLPVTYDASVIEKLRGLLGQQYRQQRPPESDWLSDYLGVSNATERTRPPPS